jgi:hypothetical protein
MHECPGPAEHGGCLRRQLQPAGSSRGGAKAWPQPWLSSAFGDMGDRGHRGWGAAAAWGCVRGARAGLWCRQQAGAASSRPTGLAGIPCSAGLEQRQLRGCLPPSKGGPPMRQQGWQGSGCHGLVHDPGAGRSSSEEKPAQPVID